MQEGEEYDDGGGPALVNMTHASLVINRDGTFLRIWNTLTYREAVAEIISKPSGVAIQLIEVRR